MTSQIYWCRLNSWSEPWGSPWQRQSEEWSQELQEVETDKTLSDGWSWRWTLGWQIPCRIDDGEDGHLTNNQYQKEKGNKYHVGRANIVNRCFKEAHSIPAWVRPQLSWNYFAKHNHDWSSWSWFFIKKSHSLTLSQRVLQNRPVPQARLVYRALNKDFEQRPFFRTKWWVPNLSLPQGSQIFA